MKVVYEAANGIEAHMIVHLLQQSGIYGRVDGEFLQGAMGELPAAGNVRVSVNAEAVEAARRVITDWEATQPAVSAEDQPASGAQKTAWFLAGVVVGALAVLLVLR